MSNAEFKVLGAVKALGGQKNVGEIVGVSQQTVSQWVISDRVPAKHVQCLEKALVKSGSFIDRHDLCPDVFGERVVSDVAQSA